MSSYSTQLTAESTAAEAAELFRDDIKGKVVLVTGVSPGGLGFEASRVIAGQDPALLILAARDPAKVEATKSTILSEFPSAQMRTCIVDFASLASVREAATSLSDVAKIDVLINNAGIMACPYRLTKDGFESQFGVNHLGPFLFTLLLKDKLLHARIVNVSSWGHNYSGIRWDDVGFSDGKTYDKWAAYGQSKTANILFAVGIADKWGIEAFAVHPGAVMTNLARDIAVQEGVDAGFFNPDGTPNMSFDWKLSLGQGAQSLVAAAFDPNMAPFSPCYVTDCKLSPELAAAYATDKAQAERLWTLSEKLVGL